MTTQAIRPELLSARDWQHFFARSPSEGISNPHEDEASAEGQHSFDHFDSDEVRQIVSGIAIAVLMTDSDDRLDYLQAVNPVLTEEHLGAISKTTERWLNNQWRERVRKIARNTYESKADPRDMVVHWNTSEEVERLIGLLLETSIPDKTLAICYAMSMAYDTAFSALFIHENRVEAQVDFAGIKQTPEEIAADLRFANST